MKKVFVSHSSQDKDVVDLFIDKILKLGLSFKSDDIAYTSREETGVRTGEDIKEFIKENISDCDFVFFMISDNYAESKICLNEMGAAWAKERRVIPIVFPDVGFDSIGWLYITNKGIRLTDSDGLDTLFDEVKGKYGIGLPTSAWNRHKEEFLNEIDEHFATKAETDLPVIIPEVVEELDLLDCREGFDRSLAENLASVNHITEILQEQTIKTNINAKRLSDITNNSKNPSTYQTRTIMQLIAYDNNKLADVYDVEIPAIKKSFEKMIFYGIKMRQMSSVGEDSIKEERDAILLLIETLQDNLSSTKELKATLENDNTNLDKTHSKSRKRLIKCLDEMEEVLKFCLQKGAELLSHT